MSMDDIHACPGQGQTAHNGNQPFPFERWRQLSDSGLFSAAINEATSASERLQATVRSFERLGEGQGEPGLNFSAATHLASTIIPLLNFGSNELKQRYLADLGAGNLIGAHAISEPEAGSDALGMTTRARQSGDSYVLNGSKAFVTNGPIADVIVIYAKTRSGRQADSVSAFLVDSNNPGLRRGPPLSKAGLATSPLGTLQLENCQIHRSQMLGREGAGLMILSHVMKHEILYCFSAITGEMHKRIERTRRFARQRSQFGQPIGSFQSVSNKIANMKINYELSRNWLHSITDKLAAGKDVTMDIAIAKVFISESSLKSAIDALDIHGGQGFLSATGLSNDVCNALASSTYSGTNDIQRGRIAALLGVQVSTATKSSRGPVHA